MKSKKQNELNTEFCCSSGRCCGARYVSGEEELKCPVCGKKGVSVKSETVKSIIKKNKKVSLNENFYLCENANCNVLYFSNNDIFYTKDSNIDIDFKKSSKTKYACYCNKLSYNEVREIVKKYIKYDWAFVVKTAKGKIAKSDCLHKNPYGSCCISNSFKKAVKESCLKFKGGC